ncbi:S8 family serine peptidase [Streptomyces sp. NPDC050738]|uniref:S8 family serine peptidase n=1 Tax=Streptomyces sp. NPDC050738 TaxID=3154744 RepID=UPI00341D4FE4
MRSISRRRSIPAAAALTLALAGGSAVPANSAEDPAGDAAQSAAPATTKSYDITLVTGDLVHFTDGPGTQDVVTVDPADGSTGGVQVLTQGSDTYVLPAEAMGLLAAGKLDQRLFDVTRLVAMGYDDAHADAVPVIATGTSSRSRSATPPAAPAGAKTVRTLPSIHATALHTDKSRARAFWKDIAPGDAPRALSAGVDKLWLDGKVEASLAGSTAQINAPAAWSKGLDGSGVKVAVLDSGADVDHPDLKDQIVGSKSFVPGETVDDGHGHGTHTASTIAGTGAASNGVEKGTAPGARLLVGKVLANSGSGADSGVIAGMEWAKEQGAAVVSMSLGNGEDSDGSDPMSQALDALSANGGPLYVVAAGNAYDPGTIGAPGAAASALTVAAVDKNDERADFSSQGPLIDSYALKPDVSAPGVDISAAASQSVPGWTGGWYKTMSGTSMATPHVAGAAAILKQRHPDWSGQRIKDTLMSSSARISATPYEAGTGRIDVAAAVDSTVEANGSVAAASYKWPNSGAQPATRTITYRNSGTSDVTLALSLGTAGSAYSLSASSVSVPAGDTTDVTLTLDPSKVPAGTSFSGQVVATDSTTGTVAAHTGFAMYKEQELYDYTVKVLGRDGKPTAGTVVLHEDGSDTPLYLGVNGEDTLRLPPGTYTATTYMDIPGDSPDSLGKALLISPDTALDATHTSGTVTLDASKARKAYAVTDRESAVTQASLDVSRVYDTGSTALGSHWNTTMMLPIAFDSIYLSPTPKVDKGTLKAFVHWRTRENALKAETGSGHAITLTAQGSTVFHDGTATLKTVYAGKGAAADYTGLDVKGKAVVIDRSGAVTASQRAQAAADAGAALLVIVNDKAGRLYASYTGGGDTTVTSVSRTDGARLVSEATSGYGRITVRQKQFPGYTYDLLQSYQGSIPDAPLAYRPRDGELARVDAAYAGAPGTLGQGARYFAPSWGPALGGDEYELYGRTVTEYVTAEPDGMGSWYEQHSTTGGGPSLAEMNLAAHYTAGRHSDEEWFKPVQAPRLGTGYTANYSRTGTFQWNIAMWSDGDDGHLGIGGAGTQTALYQGDTLVAKANAQSGHVFHAPAGAYRLTATGQRNGQAWPTSTSTTWGFEAKAIPADGPVRADLPLLNLSYDVDTDLQGLARAGKKLELGLRSATYPGDVKATAATLQVSYDDGVTWQQAELRKTADGRWTTVLRTPSDGHFVSLKTSAQAPGGLTVDQEIIRAVGLR